MASMVAYPSESLLSELLEDDRVPLRLEALEAALLEEVHSLSGLSEPTWELLGSCCASGGPCLRANVFLCSSACVCCLYQTQNILPCNEASLGPCGWKQ